MIKRCHHLSEIISLSHFHPPLALSLALSRYRSRVPSLRRYPLFGDSMYIGALVEGRRHGFGKQVNPETSVFLLKNRGSPKYFSIFIRSKK
jgi:hypothetical protein